MTGSVSSPGRLRAATWMLGGAAAVALVAIMLSLGTVASGLIGAAVQLVFVLPGVAIVRRAQAREDGWLTAVAFGPLVGLGASSLALLGYWVAGGRGAWLLAAAPATALLLAWPAGRLRDRWRWPATHRADAPMLLVCVLLAFAIIGPAFAHVGAETSEGRVYRQYFTADYVWRRAVVAELAKGEFPPVNPYYTRDVLHYYWLPHLLSAVEHRVWPDVDLDSLLLTRTVLVDMMFVAALYGMARLVVATPWAAAAGVACGFMATSVELWAALWHLRQEEAPLHFVRYLNIDAISRWYWGGMPIDGLQRILWYQPHHAAGYILGFLGLVVLARRRRERDPQVFTVAGALLGTSLLISSFAGLMYTAVAATFETLQTVRRRAWVSALFNAPYAALPLAISAAIVTALDYVDHPPGDTLSVIRLGLNPLSVVNVFTVTVMSFGPALLLGAVGVWAARRRRVTDVWPFLVVVPVSAVFYFFVDVRDHQDVYVGWRVGHLVFMALIPVIALGFAWAAQDLRGTARTRVLAGMLLVVGVASPTVVLDAFNTQDIVPNGMGRQWRRYEVITPAESEGLTWLRQHTAPNAVVQVDTQARNGEMWAYLPAFAERRMGAGIPISMVPLHKYEEGARRVHWMYGEDAESAFLLANRVGIDYIVVGEWERRGHRGIEERFDQRPDLLPKVFHNAAMTIYQVQHHRS